jgi:hypothetical protein
LGTNQGWRDGLAWAERHPWVALGMTKEVWDHEMSLMEKNEANMRAAQQGALQGPTNGPSSSGGRGGRGGGITIEDLKRLQATAGPAIDNSAIGAGWKLAGVEMDRTKAETQQVEADRRFYDNLRRSQRGTRNNLNQDMQGQGFGDVGLGRLQSRGINQAQSALNSYRSGANAGTLTSNQDRWAAIQALRDNSKRYMNFNVSQAEKGL